MKSFIPNFIPLSSIMIAHLEKLDTIESHEELELEILRFNLVMEKGDRVSFESEIEQSDYEIAKNRIEEIILNPSILHLDLSHLTELSELPISISNLTNLTSLNLRGTKVSDITSLENLTNLNLLDIKGTEVSDISILAGLRSLITINLTATKVADLTELTKSRSLQTIFHQGKRLSVKNSKIVELFKEYHLPY